MRAVSLLGYVVDVTSLASANIPLSLPLPCRARIGLQADAVRRARRMRLETPASPRKGRGHSIGGARWI